ncbi:MAG: hypothetical protein F9K30_14215 [Dechloromonas sp.]|nr:MAG: hypothetical protein F9K30_14215 [Dechloromonas sp.]
MKGLLRGIGSARANATGSRLVDTWRTGMQRLGLHAGGQPCLLLRWDVSGLQAALFDSRKGDARLLGEAESRDGRLTAAVAVVLQRFAEMGLPRPRHALLAARHLLPAVVDLPVAPDKPRPAAQMRELIQTDLEPALAEFGSLWSMGALLQARGYLDGEARQRITLEESIRRQGRQTPLRYGETALELELIERAALDECLDQQAALQNLDARIVAGWCGRIEDKQPLWLACGVGERIYGEWREALGELGLQLDAVLPLAWLTSEAAPSSLAEAGTRGDERLPQISLELHREEVVAVCRRQGHIVGSRSEGRIERELGADWLNRIIADWTSEPRATITLLCLHAEDEAGIAGLADDLNLTTGHTCHSRDAETCRQALWRNLLAQGQARVPGLPRLVDRELRGSPWKNHDIRRLAALAGVLLLLAGAETYQRVQLAMLEERIASRQQKEQERSKAAQQAAQVNQKVAELARSLDEARRQLEPLVNDRSRLNALIAMQGNLPDLLYLLAQSVGTDAVLDAVENDISAVSGAAVHVRAWSPSYTGAQAFVSRVAEQVRSKAYGVAQTEINEREGRTGKAGHEVVFWLLPEEVELEAGAPELPAATAGNGISNADGERRR